MNRPAPSGAEPVLDAVPAALAIPFRTMIFRVD
jgi:hypothetical protein